MGASLPSSPSVTSFSLMAHPVRLYLDGDPTAVSECASGTRAKTKTTVQEAALSCLSNLKGGKEEHDLHTRIEYSGLEMPPLPVRGNPQQGKGKGGSADVQL